MEHKNAYKSILREYEADRSRAEELYIVRRDALYERIPRLKEIDIELNEAGIAAVKSAITSVSVFDGDCAQECTVAGLARLALSRESADLL